MPRYRWATDEPGDLPDIARRVIEMHHAWILDYPLRFLWRDEAKVKRSGSTTFATAEVMRGRTAWLAMCPEDHRKEGQESGPAMFVIEVAEDTWALLDDRQRVALLDHELCHCTLDTDTDGPPKMAMRDHDFEEFVEIMARHGAWEETRRKAVDAANRYDELRS